MLKRVVRINIFVETVIIVFQNSLISRKFRQHLFEIELLWNILNGFAFTFDLFNMSFLNKSINFIQKYKTFEQSYTAYSMTLQYPLYNND